MTSEQAVKSLTPAQQRLFAELQKPRPQQSNEPGVYLSRRQRRSVTALERLGWVSHYFSGGDTMAWARYQLTDLGKLIAGPIVFTPTMVASPNTGR